MKVVKNLSRTGRLVTNPTISTHHSTTAASRLRVSTVPRHLFAEPLSENDVTIWNLPEEILVYLFRGLHIKDLLKIRSVHPSFRDLIDNNATLWLSASFADTWPSITNLKHFEKAAKYRNIESLLKLGIAYLYNEGLPHDEEGQRMRTNGMVAAAMFCDVETLTPNVTPFTWLFIRPPWSAGRACCKECVFKNMLLYVKQHNDSNVAMCVSQILKLFDDPESQQRVRRYLTVAANGGSGSAMYQLWMEKYRNKMSDVAVEVHAVRELREIASTGDLDSQLSLCRYYCSTQYASAAQYRQHYGITRDQIVHTVRTFLQSSQPANAHLIFTYHPDISTTMRYILVDWLVEVAGMKDFSTHTLHVAISVVDRFLRAHVMSRSRLQLLGVAAMVLCSRFLGRDIITIREAAWLTDNTYKYEDVVRMMGEVVATLRGKIWVVTILDYLYILEELAKVDDKTKYLAEFACEMSLLYADLSRYKKAEIAASCLLLANLVLEKEYPWPNHVQEFSGFTVATLTKCVIHLHSKCFVSNKVTDHRDVELDAVKKRYSVEAFSFVGEHKMLSLEAMCRLLGVSEHVIVDDELQIRYKSITQATAPGDAAGSCGTAASSCTTGGSTASACLTTGGSTSSACLATGGSTPSAHQTKDGVSVSSYRHQCDELQVCTSATVDAGKSGGCNLNYSEMDADRQRTDQSIKPQFITSKNNSYTCLRQPPVSGEDSSIPVASLSLHGLHAGSSGGPDMRIHRRSHGARLKSAPIFRNQSSSCTETTPGINHQSSSSTETTPIIHHQSFTSKAKCDDILKSLNVSEVGYFLHDHSGRHNIPGHPVHASSSDKWQPEPDEDIDLDYCQSNPASPMQCCPMDEDPLSPQKMDSF